MKNKKGSALLTIGIIVLIIGALVGIYAIVDNKFIDKDVESAVKCSDSTGKLTVNAVSALEGASDPSSPTITCGTDGGKVKTSVTSGTTAFAIGTELECLVSKADYIDASFNAKVPCGGLVQEVEMYYATSDNPSLKIKDPRASSAEVTDAIAGGATNLTDTSVGGTVKFDAYFEGTNTEGTGDMVYIIEFPAGSDANITTVTMGSLQSVNVPRTYVANNAGSEIVAFAVPNIEGAVEEVYSVIATLGTGKDMVGGVYTEWRAGQAFVDDDGYITEGVINSLGDTNKYENSDDFDFLIG
jgi:hypothetical protein